MSILDFDFESTTREEKISGIPLWLTTIKAGNIQAPVRRYGETNHKSFLRALTEYNRQCEEQANSQEYAI